MIEFARRTLCARTSEKGIWRREGFELGGVTFGINKLLNKKEFLAPSIPTRPRIWQ